MENNEYSILLNSAKNKKNINLNMSIDVDLSVNKKLLNGENTSSIIDSYKIYLDERKKSNKFRIILNINPFCSNVLFNPITEIVKDEGSDSAICLNFSSMAASGFSGDVIGKDSGFTWDNYSAVRDTQLSNDSNGFIYHCGVDIFNNHILRNKTFKSVNFNEKYKTKRWPNLGRAYSDIGVADEDPYSNQKYYNNSVEHYSPPVYDNSFNTIDDYMRDRYGAPIVKTTYYMKKNPPTQKNDVFKYNVPLHLYQKYDVYSFEDSIKENLKEINGWFGFSNKSVFNALMLNPRGEEEEVSESETFSVDPTFIDQEGVVNVVANAEKTILASPAKTPRINKAINNKLTCEFIDMYPERDLFSFTPNYNEYRKRLEKNWNYCLTYPSEHVYNVDGVNFLFSRGRKTPALKVDRFDENIVDDNGLNVIITYSICQHGLRSGDHINLYKHYNEKNTLLYSNAEVIKVYDKYTFSITKTESYISNEWVNLNLYTDDELFNGIEIGEGRTYKYNNSTFMFGNEYPVCGSKWVSVDDTCMNLFFVKVVNNIECEYYIRKFTRIPNFKFSDTEINDYNVNKYNANNENSIIYKFNDPLKKSCDFENHISKIGFADTNYSDGVAQIVYTDDIDISYLKDNLGRPVSDIYLTIVKNNNGYKEWYGIDDTVQNVKSTNVEYSHCFGKNKAQFLLSDFYRIRTENNAQDVRDITANQGGLGNATYGNEIVFDEDRSFYGDLCCYSPSDCIEQSIQNVMCRFNTVQREISLYNVKDSVLSAFSSFKYDEITQDDNTMLPSKLETLRSSDKYSSVMTASSTGYPEGYYYQMHYRIPLKDVSDTLSSDQGIKYELYSMSVDINGIKVRTQEPNGFSLDERLMIYDKDENNIYYMSVAQILTDTIFVCNIFDEFGEKKNEYIADIINNDISYLKRFVFLKRHESVPSYAKIIKDGSCRYYWRNIVSNGIEDNDIVYPFANGAFYITKTFNFFLRRQDPFMQNLSYRYGDTYNYVPGGEPIDKYYDIDDGESYESNEVDDCSFDIFGAFKDVAGETSLRYVIGKSREKINNVLR